MNNELIERIDAALHPITSFESMAYIMDLLHDCKAALSEPVASVPQDVEGFIVENELPAFGDDSKVFTFIRTATLRAWMAGNVRVPVLPEKADPLTDNYSSWDVGYNEGWNDCRTAMLTASKESEK